MTDREHEFVAVGLLAAALVGALYLSSRTSATPAPGGSPAPSPSPCPPGWTANAAGTTCCPPPHLAVPCRAIGAPAPVATAGADTSSAGSVRSVSF